MRILLIAGGFINSVSGIGKVMTDLKLQYEKKGHIVDILDFSVIYPKGYLSVYDRIIRKRPQKLFFLFLKKHAMDYDVIDSEYAWIVYPKKSFNFNGVLMARSHGLRPLYMAAEKDIPLYKSAMEKNKKNIKFKTRIGNLYRKLHHKTGNKDFERSVVYSDILHCLNSGEIDYFRNCGIHDCKLLLLPNGLPKVEIDSFNGNGAPSQRNNILFLGAWSTRKGIDSLNYILTEVRKEVEVNKFYILGGGWGENIIRSSFSNYNQSVIHIVSKFNRNEFNRYLSDIRVGIFPSYIEGFAMAVLEQIASGIPIVAYEIPALKDAFSEINGTLMQVGDPHAIVNKTIEILKMDKVAFSQLSLSVRNLSEGFILENIADSFINRYNKYFTDNNR